MAMTSLTIQMDDDLREKAESYFSGWGLDMESAINLIIRKTINEDKTPFELIDSDDFSNVSDDEYFKHPENITALKLSLRQLREGKVIEKTLEELKSYEE